MKVQKKTKKTVLKEMDTSEKVKQIRDLLADSGRYKAIGSKNFQNIIKAYDLIDSIEDDEMKSNMKLWFNSHIGEVGEELVKHTINRSEDPINKKRVELAGKDLSRWDLRGAKLQGANLRGANLQGARLGCTKDGTSCTVLQNADLTGANLKDASLQGTDFRGAKLSGADMTITWTRDEIEARENFGTSYKDAEYNSKTKFPPGVNPEKLGMIKVEISPEDDQQQQELREFKEFLKDRRML